MTLEKNTRPEPSGMMSEDLHVMIANRSIWEMSARTSEAEKEYRK
jgi:hypothetical protein